jgi:hypothetical protein
MRTFFTLGSFLVLAVVQSALANQVVLSPVDDAQYDRAAFLQPDVVTNPPTNGLYTFRLLNSSGEIHEGYLEYSLASLPSNATVTAASFTYGVDLITHTSSAYPSLTLDLYDGGDGQVTISDLYKNGFNVAQSQDLTGLGTYTTNFFSVIPLNNRATNFPSGYLGFQVFPRVEGYQAGLRSAEDAQQFGGQAPVLTITYTVPEPGSLALLGTAGALLLVCWRAKRRR